MTSSTLLAAGSPWNGLDRRVAEDDLFDAVGGGIALEGSDYVLGEERADCGHLAQERERHGLGPVGVARHARAAEAFVARGARGLLDQDLVGRIEVRGEGEAELRVVERAGRVVAQVHDRLQMMERLDHLPFVGQMGAAEAVDEAPGPVTGRHLADHLLELASALACHARP